MAWTYLIGAVTTELYGQRHRVITDDALAHVYDLEVDRIVELVGLTA
jgi:hypothetical protein